MKLIVVLLTACFLHVSGKGTAQTVSLSGKDMPLRLVFDEIKRQTGYELIWDKEIVKENNKIDIDIKSQPLKTALDICFRGQHLHYQFIDNVIIITKTPSFTGLAAMNDPLKIVSGQVVTEKEKQPVEGVNIAIKGTSRGTITDAYGNFRISAETGDVLVITSVGYVPQEVKLTGRDNYTIYLQVAVEGLDQAVVVGYGTQSKRNITGAIAKVEEIKPEENITSNVFSALQGRVAGLAVKNSDGTPGAAPSFSIRGVQTTNISNVNPLIVVDGLIVDAGQGFGGTNNPNFNISNLNPQDIESVEVLKDASSSAIYGARGAQGVIMITTKKGKLNSRPSVNINSYYGITRSTLGYRSLNNAQYEAVFKEARQNRIGDIEKEIAAGGLPPGRLEVLTDEMDLLNNEINSFELGTPIGLFDNDWVDKVIPDNASTHNIQASVSGGSANNTYYFSFGKYSEENSIGGGRYNRYSGKLALTQKINRWLRIGGDFNVSLSQSKNLTYPLADAIDARPDTPDSLMINEDGTVGYWFGMQNHPYTLSYKTSVHSRNWNYMGNFFGEITFMPGLTLKSTLAGVNNQSTSISFYSPLSYFGSFVGGQHTNSGNNGIQYTFNNILTYKLSYGLLKGDLLLGQEYYQNKNATTSFTIIGFPSSEGLWLPGNGSGFSNDDLFGNRNYFENGDSYFFRSNLSWDNKYLLSASIRRDGTSKLTDDNRYSWFPALSAGWIISEEDFFNKQGLFSFFKIKSGIGLTGNIRTLNYFDFANLITTTTYLGAPALALGAVRGNPDLTWERTKQYDAGIETRMFNNRVSLTLEFYSKRTDGLITSLPLPYSTGGFSSQKGNLGTVENKGIDIDLSYSSAAANSNSFTWNAGIVLNINRNKILYLRDSVLGYGFYFPTGPRTFVKTGQSVGSLLLYKSLGVDPNTGDLVYEDKNKDGIINMSDQEYIPVAQPKFSGGINLGANWKQFSVSANFVFTVGNQIYNLDDQYSRTFNTDFFGVMPNKPEWVLERWQKPGDDSYYPRAIVGAHGAGQTNDWNSRPSTQYLFDASYLRFRNLTVGYQFDNKLLTRIGVPSLRVYASFQNLFLIKDKSLKTTDPEVGLETGLQQTAVPIPRTVAFGIDVTL